MPIVHHTFTLITTQTTPLIALGETNLINQFNEPPLYAQGEHSVPTSWSSHPPCTKSFLLRQKRPNHISRFIDRKHTIQVPAVAFDHEHIR